ncbi:nucleophile aminohydrolase [Pseudomassariella vexata]|uniref:Nucleophile aminohydrolase n=1 Tax=Pseudomassariella vexata TaxID=1141098 RepID=A0A1Y2DL78_9PEZI|nr:nucleophile aminohydrolase [Pseudomassariella vexata]ORY59971.1 nucleophile aminohydrolase [Pseudomassariella vexata]
MALIPNDWLISRNARDRYVRWQEDLKRADMQSRDVTPSTPTKTPNPEYDEETHQKAQRDHTTAILTGTWNEGQPDSPVHPATPSDNGPPLAPHVPSPLKAQTPQSNGSTSSRLQDRSPLSFLGSKYTSKTDNSESPKTGSPDRKRPRFLERHSTSSPRNSDVGNPDAMDTGDGTGSLPNDRSTIPCLSDTVLKNLGTLVDPATAKEVEDLCTSNLSPASRKDSIFDGEYDEDMITDTVGAIAIDQDGHMAAGSSSGGIGMKHRGRVGPAALVGIGTAIIPADDSDRDSVTVGAVTSGTGEHMATTVAAQKCAERLYHGSVRGEGGFDVREDDESAIMESFIMHDFQLHPGVLNSSSAGAIGVMAVKQAPGGFYLYFAHNTDSFALASMGSSDRDPHCVMSRIDEKSRDRIAQGARKIRVD